MKSEQSKMCRPSKKVREAVYERDEYRCRLCGKYHFLELAHYVPRSKGGLAIAENLLLLCRKCHMRYDQSSDRQVLMLQIGMYLDTHYENFDHNKRFYSKNLTA